MIDNSEEYVLCAAILWDDGEKYPIQPLNIKTGFVICGGGHANCIAISSIMRKNAKEESAFLKTPKSGTEQGFFTSRRRFVGRNEAAKIARDAGQLNDRIDWTDANWETVELYSEDIYHNYAK